MERRRTYHGRWTLILTISSAAFFQCDGNGNHSQTGPTGDELQLSSKTLPMATTGYSYSTELNPTGGITLYTYTASNLPPGLALQGDEKSVGIEGTPTQAGMYTITVTVSNQGGDKVTGNFPIWVVDMQELDLSGSWSFVITVTESKGDCSGDDIGIPDSVTIALQKSGNHLIASGFLSDPMDQIEGSIFVGRVSLRGCYREDGGTTHTDYSLDLYSPEEMRGEEEWDWRIVPTEWRT